jgi:hypothetical protein
MVLPSCLASCKIASYSSPQYPNLTQSSSGSHFSATWVRTSLPFKKRSNVPSSLLTSSRTVFRDWLESFPVRLTRHPKSIMPVETILKRVTVYRGSCRETLGFGNRPVRSLGKGNLPVMRLFRHLSEPGLSDTWICLLQLGRVRLLIK